MNKFITILSIPFVLCGLGNKTSAQNATDSIIAIQKELQEVVVTAQNRQAIDHGIRVMLTESDKRHSSNSIELLQQLMIPGMRVDALNDKVETSWGGEVHYFIDGQEAQEWEVKSLRPKEVAHIEFLLSPSNPQYKNYQAVINFIMRRYDYGGYLYADGSQGFVNNFGNYAVSGKYKRNKMTWQAMGSAYYRNADNINESQDVTYLFDQENKINKQSSTKRTQNQRDYLGAVSGRYDSKKLVWIVQSGIRYSDTPKDNALTNLNYRQSGEPDELTSSFSNSNSSTLAPYVSGVIQTTALPHGQEMYGGISFSYNRNEANSLYGVDNKQVLLPNGYKEDVYLPEFWVTYKRPILKNNSLTFQLSATNEIYRTQYSGTTDTYQKLQNSYYYLLGRYNHTFSETWNGSLLLNVPIEAFKINNDSWKVTPYINGTITLNGRIGSRHSFYVGAQIYQSQIKPSYYNSVIRQDTEVEGSQGSPDLKTMQQCFAVLSYTWMPRNAFSLNASVKWDNIVNDIVPYWHPVGELMVKEMVNSGDFNPLYLSLSPSFSLFSGKLRISSKLSYVHEWHDGLYHVNNGYWGVYPSISYRMNKYLSASLTYAYSSGKGYMRGGSYLSEFSSNKLSAKLQYTKGNFFASCTVNSIPRKNGWVKSWLDAEYIHDYRYVSRPWDGRYITISASYTIDFGKKMKHGNDLQYSGTSKSSVL